MGEKREWAPSLRQYAYDRAQECEDLRAELQQAREIIEMLAGSLKALSARPHEHECTRGLLGKAHDCDCYRAMVRRALEQLNPGAEGE